MNELVLGGQKSKLLGMTEYLLVGKIRGRTCFGMHAGHGCMRAKEQRHICFGTLGGHRSMWFGMVAGQERTVAAEA